MLPLTINKLMNRRVMNNIIKKYTGQNMSEIEMVIVYGHFTLFYMLCHKILKSFIWYYEM